MLQNSAHDLSALLSQNKRELDQIMLDFLPLSHSDPSIARLYEMMRDYPSRGGKGIRGTLCLLWCELFGGKRENALVTAAALELYQNWILIHDDIEDESDLRRGSPALHKKYGVPLSINAGDALHGKMWELLLENRKKVGADICLRVLSEFCTMLNETTEGQQMELGWTTENKWNLNEQDYFRMVTKKSAWYTCITPSRLGYVLSRSGIGLSLDSLIVRELTAIGTSLGISFQITDDILNLTASESKYGKEIAGDLYEGKRTLMVIHLLADSSTSERTRIVSTLSKPRSEKDRSQVNEILDMMEKRGSIEYARSVAKEFYKRSRASFDELVQTLDPSSSEAKETIKLIFEYIARRDR